MKKTENKFTSCFVSNIKTRNFGTEKGVSSVTEKQSGFSHMFSHKVSSIHPKWSPPETLFGPGQTWRYSYDLSSLSSCTEGDLEWGNAKGISDGWRERNAETPFACLSYIRVDNCLDNTATQMRLAGQRWLNQNELSVSSQTKVPFRTLVKTRNMTANAPREDQHSCRNFFSNWCKKVQILSPQPFWTPLQNWHLFSWFYPANANILRSLTGLFHCCIGYFLRYLIALRKSQFVLQLFVNNVTTI